MAKNDKKADEVEKVIADAMPADEVELATNDKAAPKKPSKDSTEGLVKLQKNGDTLHVHPTTVDAHVSAGWKHA